MKSRYLAIAAIAAVAFTAGCATPTAQPVPRKTGFLERAWISTQKGSQKIWASTKTGASDGWQSTKDLVAAPFSEKKSTKISVTDYRRMETGIQIKPDPIRLATTHAIETTVQITNKADRALQLIFPTSQHIEIVVKTEDGKVIQRWSEDQRIERESSFVAVNPDERLEYVASISTRNMVAGKTYVIEASVLGYDAIFARKVVVPQS